jgi:hypothetical protein
MKKAAGAKARRKIAGLSRFEDLEIARRLSPSIMNPEEVKHASTIRIVRL